MRVGPPWTPGGTSAWSGIRSLECSIASGSFEITSRPTTRPTLPSPNSWTVLWSRPIGVSAGLQIFNARSPWFLADAGLVASFRARAKALPADVELKGKGPTQSRFLLSRDGFARQEPPG